VTAAFVVSELAESIGLVERIGVGVLVALAIFGLVVRNKMHHWIDRLQTEKIKTSKATDRSGWNRPVSPRAVGLNCLAGLIAFSVVACYAYYPPPGELLEEMRIARTEVLAGSDWLVLFVDAINANEFVFSVVACDLLVTFASCW